MCGIYTSAHIRHAEPGLRMGHTLENSRLSFALDAASGRWSLALRKAAAPLIESAEWGAAFWMQGRRVYRAANVRAAQVDELTLLGPAGESRSALRIEVALDPSGVRLRGEFALLDDSPALLVRLTLINSSPRAIQGARFVIGRAGPAAVRRAGNLRPFTVFRAPAELPAPGAVRLAEDPSELRCYVNGWQSWSFAGALGENDRQPGPRLGPVTIPMHAGAAFPWPNEQGHFRSDMFAAIRSAAGGALTLGFLAQREQFGCVEVWLDRLSPSVMMTADLDGVVLAPGREIASDWAYIGLEGLEASGSSEANAFEGYLDLVARENGARTTREPPFGWCSWYHYFTRITDDELQRNVVAAARLKRALPVRLIQLDDGFQADVGDWHERNAKFPRDMRAVAEGIRALGFTPGLWLAPLIAKPSAGIVRRKPGWWLRGRWGRAASAGLVWFKWGRGLDPTQPEALAHAAALIHTAAHEWGFPYLKLDFLYAAALDAQRADRTVTRAQALRRALEAIRAAAGDETFLLGCGCPLGSGVGIFDAMRIGPDVDFHWYPTFRPISPWIRHDPTYPSARNSIRDTLSRAMLHRRWWWNDPDCLLARDTDSRLTLDERRTLATAIGLSGGALLVSDDLNALSDDSLRMVQAFLPPNTRAARVVGWDEAVEPDTVILDCSGATGVWHVVARFNWSDTAARADLDLHALGLPQHAEGFSFWDSRHIAAAQGKLPLGLIPAHGVTLVAVRTPCEAPAFVGSSLHFTQGGEVADWRTSRNGLSLELALDHDALGSLFVRLPARPTSALVDGRSVAVTSLDGGLYRLDLVVGPTGHLEVRW